VPELAPLRKTGSNAPRPTSLERTIQFSRTERKERPSVLGAKNLEDLHPAVNRKSPFSFRDFRGALELAFQAAWPPRVNRERRARKRARRRAHVPHRVSTRSESDRRYQRKGTWHAVIRRVRPRKIQRSSAVEVSSRRQRLDSSKGDKAQRVVRPSPAIGESCGHFLRQA
jgi:hypothetical protein